MPESARTRPDGCCSLRPLDPLPEGDRRRLVQALKALADSTRIEIMRLIRAQDGPTCACDIVDHFDLSQPTISHHLRVLREAGLLTATKAGIWSFYAPDPAGQALVPRVSELLE